jgi:DUF971 family protein
MTDAEWPDEIRLSPDKTRLTLVFSGGEPLVLEAEYLRVESPSAEVQGHSPDEKKTIAGKRSVHILGLEPVGNYAVRIRFDDGHDTGLFTWAYLKKLGTERGTIWQTYLDRLAAAGLSR